MAAPEPSVARDIARVLGATSRGDGYLHGNGYVVTWAVGHLAALAQPHEIKPEWRLWRRDLLPILPNRWPLVVYEKTKGQFEIVRKIRGSPRISRVVCATDAGRAGRDDACGAGAISDVVVGLGEYRVIERVEELRAEFQIGALREKEQFPNGNVAGDSTGTIENVLSGIAERVAVGDGEGVDIEPEVRGSFAGGEIAVGDTVGSQ